MTLARSTLTKPLKGPASVLLRFSRSRRGLERSELRCAVLINLGTPPSYATRLLGLPSKHRTRAAPSESGENGSETLTRARRRAA
jgi:hypothetical protein